MATIALAGGGTGGHVYPALAVGAALAARGHELLYIGDAGRLEGRVVPERGLPFRAIVSPQYPRGGGPLGKARFGLGLLRATLQARRHLVDGRVDAVFGVGGYIAAPTVLAAWSLGLPRVVHEANAVPGLANRLCFRVADRILLTFPATLPHVPAGRTADVVGFPVDPRVRGGTREGAAARYGLDPSRPTVGFVGGSLGAEAINGAALAFARRAGRTHQVLHLCGPRYEAEVRAALGDDHPEGYALVPYEDEMRWAYAMADLMVCRAGSATVAELRATGTPALFVPSPNVTDDHQRANAEAEASEGGFVVTPRGAERTEVVLDALSSLLADGGLSRLAAQLEAREAPQDAAERIAAQVDDLV